MQQAEAMKRAIYVGNPRLALSYGITGEVTTFTHGGPDGDVHHWIFKGDGWENALGVERADVYIPSEDMTRCCPPPNPPIFQQ